MTLCYHSNGPYFCVAIVMEAAYPMNGPGCFDDEEEFSPGVPTQPAMWRQLPMWGLRHDD